jgi:hypothetical protein
VCTSGLVPFPESALYVANAGIVLSTELNYSLKLLKIKMKHKNINPLHCVLRFLCIKWVR